VWQTSLPSGSLMSGMRNEQRNRAAYKPPSTPLNFAQGSLVYTSRVRRRRRNRKYLLAAALLILAVGTGLVVVLLANWLSGSR
jgi:hypothetical protein